MDDQQIEIIRLFGRNLGWILAGGFATWILLVIVLVKSLFVNSRLELIIFYQRKLLDRVGDPKRTDKVVEPDQRSQSDRIGSNLTSGPPLSF
jgi:hypothetical protein